MMKNRKYIIFIGILIVIILILFFTFNSRNLDVQSKQVLELYHYLGEVSTDHCGGLQVYADDSITKNDIPLDNRMCMAYYEAKNKKDGTFKITGVNKNKEKICKEGDITFTTDDETCSYTKVSSAEVLKEYKKLYGENIPYPKSFYISNQKNCYEKGEEYICGTSETFNYTLSADATIYRFIFKATEKKDKITIIDYFLKISDDKCYNTNTSSVENIECTKAIKNTKEIDSRFIRKYGTKYEHVFQLNDDQQYSWLESKKK